MKIREFANKTVRHSDPLPKLSKPTTGREQEHPYTGMLVGSKYSEDQDTGMYNPKQKANQTYYKMQKFLDLALDAGFDQIKDIQNPQTFDMLVSRLAQTGVDLTDSIDVQEDLKGVAGVLTLSALLATLGLNMPSAKETPLGKELQMAAQQGDMVAAYHLKNLDLYADDSMNRTLTNLKIAYIDDNTDPKYMQFLSDPKRFPGIKPRNESTTFESLDESVGEFITEEEFDQLAEKQDACYHKVKSRYKVWPSAYASGALVKCRKVGAKNWGNSSKKKKSKKK